MRTPYDDKLYLEIASGEMSPETEAKCKQILDMLKENRTVNCTAYLEGYEAAAEQIFADIDKLHLHVSNEYEARAYEELKKKYGVK